MSAAVARRCVGALLAVGLAGLMLIRHEARAQATPIQLTEGETTTLQLDGNPSTGYTWVLQDGRSASAFVTVDLLGYAKPELKPGERPVLGAPQKFQVLVTGIEAGQTTLLFNYVRGGDPKPARTAEFAVEVLGNAAPERDAMGDSRDLFPNPNDDEDGGGNPNPY